LLAKREESRVPRFAYDRGMLEIISPSTEHEHTSHIIALLVEVFAEEMNVNVYGVGSTKFKCENLEGGARKRRVASPGALTDAGG
jgi:hypothetical protein